MTRPLTPREKVARVVYDTVTRFDGDTVGTHLGLSAMIDAAAPTVDDERRIVKSVCDDIADSVLTALASGSGDHAELAKLADDLRKFEHHAVGSLKIGMDEVRRIIAACDAHAALLAENAALRAERDGMIEEVSRSQARLHAATEAERKLAEADRKIEDLTSALRSLAEGNLGDMSWQANYETIKQVARNAISKEAERG